MLIGVTRINRGRGSAEQNTGELVYEGAQSEGELCMDGYLCVTAGQTVPTCPAVK